MYQLIVRMPFGTEIIHDEYETLHQARVARLALLLLFEPEQVLVRMKKEEK